MLGWSGAEISSGVLIETSLVSFESSLERIGSRREASLSIPNIAGSGWNVSSTNWGSRGLDAMGEVFEIEGNGLRDVTRTREANIGSSE